MADNGRHRSSLGEVFTRDFVILATINLCMFFGFQMLNVGLPVYMDQLGATGQLVGLATTVMTIAATVMRVFSGALLDKFGRKGMLIGGLAIIACSILSFAIFPIVGVILGLRVIHGIGWGLGSTSSSTIAADIIPKHRFAEGMGYFAMTTAISSAVAPAVSIAIAQEVGAVYMLYTALGMTVLALMLAVAETLLGKRADAAQPEGSGGSANRVAAPDTADQVAAPDAGRVAAPDAADRAAAPDPAQVPRYSRFDTFFERRALVPGLLMMLVNFGFGCITTFIALHASSRGVNGVTSYFIVYAVVTLVSRPYIGKLIDRHGYRIPAMISTLCTAGTLVLIGLSSSVVMFAGAGVLGGLGIGTAMGTYQAMAVADVEPWRRGVATSTYFTAFDLGIAAGSLVGGMLVDVVGYMVMYFIMALFPVAASVVSAVVIKRGR